MTETKNETPEQYRRALAGDTDAIAAELGDAYDEPVKDWDLLSRRGIGWDLFDTSRGLEIQRCDAVEGPDVPPQGALPYASDDEALGVVFQLALDGDREAQAALVLHLDSVANEDGHARSDTENVLQALIDAWDLSLELAEEILL